MIAFFLLGQVALSTNEQKAPWLWTTEERIARRVDADQRRARLQRELPSIRQVAPGWYPVNGALEPELFLPGELLSELLRGADGADRRATAYRSEFLRFIVEA